MLIEERNAGMAARLVARLRAAGFRVEAVE
jgi:hypothetical protein